MEDPKKITKAKHRLITALRRNPEIEMLEKESTFYRFRIVQNIADDGKVRYKDMTNERSMHATITEHINESKKTVENTEVSDYCDMKNVLEVRKENIDSSLFGNSETSINSTYPFSLSELYDNTPKMFPMSDIFSEELYPNDTKSSDFSDKCCCVVLLDNYLCNQKCIWHGMPP